MYCFAHDPNHAAERSRNASKAARSKPTRELSDVKKRLRELAEDVMDGSADRGDAAVAGQLLGTFIRALSVEIKLREVLELAERIAALEDVQDGEEEGSGMGASWG
jgi:transposase